jgi:peptide-methionine (S)-S-oxide reductase
MVVQRGFIGLGSIVALCSLVLAASAGGCKTQGDGATPAVSDAFTSANVSTNIAATTAKVGVDAGHAGAGTPLVAAAGHQLAAFAEGCFWGSENTYRHVNGVTNTAVGYTGGHTEHPSYEDVCTHTTGHAETVLVEFDPKVVSYDDLLSVFWKSHDPTTLNRQGPDVGDSYRSAIFVFNDAQMAAAKASEAAEQQRLAKPITTQIATIGKFWLGEGYHQQYDEKTGSESCPIFLAKPKS